jgi:cell wall-associated NlpC family hydrolase
VVNQSKSSAALARVSRRWVVAGSFCLSLVCVPSHAAPDETRQESVMRLLEQRGFLSSSSNGDVTLLSQVRDKASDLVLSAMNFIGVRYRRGGTSVEEGFDCSGFTRHIFENSIGLVLPRRADEQANAPGLLKISESDLKPGDLVFFNTLRHTFSHVGIYVGDGKFIHSPRAGGEVRVEDMRYSYWTKRFNGARRVPQVGTTSDIPAVQP